MESEAQGTLLPERRFSVDMVRAMAMLLMVSVHFCRSVEAYTWAGRAIRYIGEAAPAFFFFAFGLLLERFFAKSKDDQFQLGKLFLFVAIAQGFMAGQPFRLDFLLFIWFWQIGLAVLFKTYKLSVRSLVVVISATLMLMIIWPPNAMERIFSLTGGPFPLMPWGLFVLAGMLFSRMLHAPGNPIASVGMILISLAMMLAGVILHAERLLALKVPLTATYFLLFTGIIVFLMWLFIRYEKRLANMPWLVRPVVLLSENLLLATVLHYAAYLPLKALVVFKRHRDPTAFTEYIQQWDFVVMIAGSVAALILLIVLVWLAVRIYDGFSETGALARLRGNAAGMALAMVALLTVLHFAAERFGDLGKVSGASLAFLVFMSLLKLAAMAGMMFFALELRRFRNRTDSNGAREIPGDPS